MINNQIKLTDLRPDTNQTESVYISEKKLFEVMKEYGLPRLKEYFINNQKRRNQVRLCPLCNANMADRKVTLYKELVDSLYDVYCWLGERQRHGFEMKEIKHPFRQGYLATRGIDF